MSENKSGRSVKVYSSYIQSDIIGAKMTLENEEIGYFTQNENFAALYPLPGLGSVDFFVDERDAQRARRALTSLIKGSEE
ncbi:MAG: DUF2007 domain-containing protein [Bacteroidetes bacterium]|nr:DUF2007 domain-containing protein [Bacteroidota bacterium]